MKILPSAEKRERRGTATPYQRPKGFVDKVKDWLTPAKWVTWRDDAPVPTGAERKSHVISDASSSAGSAPPASSEPPFVPTSAFEEGGKKTIEDRSGDSVPPSALFHDRRLTGKNGLVSGSQRVAPDSRALQRLSQQMEVDETSPPVGVTRVRKDRNTSGPITSTPQVSSQALVRETGLNETYTVATKQKDKPSFSMSTFHTPSSHRHLKTEMSLSQSPFKSPFYSGRTSFGGASSLKRKRERAESSPPAGVKVSQLRVQAQPAQSSVAGSSASQTARRILNTLQSMSSPLTDARRLPLRVAPMAKRARRGPSPPLTTPPPPVSSLTTPSPAPLSAVRQPVVVPNEQRPSPGTRTVSFALSSHQATLVDSEQGRKSAMSAARGSISPRESSSRVELLTTNESYVAGKSKAGGGGKMRSSRHSSHYSSRKDSSSDNSNLLSLPPSIPLTLSSYQPLPVLSFATPSMSSSPVLQPPTSSPMAFSFAKPKPVGVGPQTVFPDSRETGPKKAWSPSGSIFGSSTLTKKTSGVGLSSSDTTLTSPRRRKELTSPSRRSRVPTLEKPTSFEPASLKSVSVLEALKRPEYQIENIRKEAQQNRISSTEVVDLTGSDSPERSQEEPVLTGKPLSLAKKPAGTWNCDACWISNKPEATSCAACGGVRAGGSTASLSIGSVSSVSPSKSLSGSGLGHRDGSSGSLASNSSVSLGIPAQSGLAISLAPKIVSQASIDSSKAGLIAQGPLTALPMGGVKLAVSLSSLSGTAAPPPSMQPPKGGIKLAVSLSSLSDATVSPSPSRSMVSPSVSGARIVSLATEGFELARVASFTAGVVEKSSTPLSSSSSSSSFLAKPSLAASSASEPILQSGSVKKSVSGEVEKSESVSSAMSISSNSSKEPLMLKRTPAGSWECPDCMLMNKPSLPSCNACGAKRPCSSGESSSDHSVSMASSSEALPAKPVLGMSTAGTVPSISVGLPGLGSSLSQPVIGADKPGTGLGLGQPGLSLSQLGAVKWPPAATGNVPGTAPLSTASLLQPPPLTLTTSSTQMQISPAGSLGFLPASSSGVVMPQLRKLSSAPSTLPSTTSGILAAALQGTAMARGGPLQVGLTTTSVSQGPSGLSQATPSPFTFALTKSTDSSTLKGLSFAAPTFPSTTVATTTTAVAVTTTPMATFNFSGAAGSKPIVTASQQSGGLFKPAVTGQGTPSLGFPLSGNTLGGTVSGGLSFGSSAAATTTTPSLSLGGPKLMFGGITATSGVGGSSMQQQETPFTFQTGTALSQNRPALSLSSGGSLSFGAAPNTGFAAPQQQPTQFGAAGVQPSMPTLTGLSQTTNTNAGFNFAQFLSSTTPQLQFGQSSALPPSTNPNLFQFGTGTSGADGGQIAPIGIVGRPMKKAVRRRR